MENITITFIYILLAAISTNIPFIGIYVALVNTLIHEVFHAITGILTGGKAKSIALHLDASGVAVTATSSRLARILVSYAGYTGASFSAVVLFYFLYHEYYTFIFYFFMGLIAISTILWVRNFVGFAWGISIIGLFYLIVYYELDFLISHISTFLSAVVLIQSITTAYTIMVLSFKQRKNAGDATSLAKATFIPAIFWGVLFFSQSIYASYYIFTQYIL